MDRNLREMARLTGRISQMIRLGFNIIPGLTPERNLALRQAVESLILDHLSHIHDVSEITDEHGFLKIPPLEDQEPRQEDHDEDPGHVHHRQC
jgi:hypothetical protein